MPWLLSACFKKIYIFLNLVFSVPLLHYLLLIKYFTSSSPAPPASQDGASSEGAAAREAETGAAQVGCQQHGIRRSTETLPKSQLNQLYSQSE